MVSIDSHATPDLDRDQRLASIGDPTIDWFRVGYWLAGRMVWYCKSASMTERLSILMSAEMNQMLPR